MNTSRNASESDDLYYRRMYTEVKERAHATHLRYQEAGIPDSVFYDTMSDIDVWAKAYFLEHGHYGIKETAWIEKSLSMKVFKLGRLQFERLEGETAKAWVAAAHSPPDTLVLNIHIQAGSALDETACEASYQAATIFYAERGFVFSHRLFVCESWLLNPLLRELLPESSNIFKFQKKYTILSSNPVNRQMEERVFGALKDNPSDYPEDTTLRKKLKEAILHGRAAGTSRGFFAA